MSPLAMNLSDADMADLAAYYAAQRPSRRPTAIDPDKAAIGRRLVDFHHCSSCHRPGFEGQQQAARLAGQDLTYLLRLIRGFREKTASDLDGTMTVATQGLAEADIEPLAHFLAGLGEGR